MHELALFAGIGGGILGGSLLGWRTVCAVEKEPYCREVLLRRQRDGVLPLFPIWDDVKTFDGRPWRGKVDIVTGGFPCQDISCAGAGAGIGGARSGLWGEMARIIGEVRPPFVFVENSPLLRTRGLAVVLKDLAVLGYDAQWCRVSASDVGASHKRDRIWIVANTSSGRRGQSEKRKVEQQGGGEAVRTGNDVADSDSAWKLQPERVEQIERGRAGYSSKEVADPDKVRRHRRTRQGEEPAGRGQPEDRSGWPTEPDVGRVADGVPDRMDRLKALGNAQVPRVAEAAFRILSGEIA